MQGENLASNYRPQRRSSPVLALPSSTGGPIDQTILEWFENERGIRPETLMDFGLRQVENYVVYPYEGGEKRRKFENGVATREFRFTPGANLTLFKDTAAVGTQQMFLCEGETDTMRLYQEVGRNATVLGISGIEAWKPEYAKEFEAATRVFVILDNDEDYNVAARVDAAYKQIRNDLGPKARRVYLPAGVKDVCEFFKVYNLDILRELCKKAATPLRRFKELDLTIPPPPIDWLVQDLLSAGDVTLLIGDPGLGKSWMTMALAVGVAEGHDEWLGHEIHKQGAVLYIDEENPEDLIHQRISKLGLTKRGAQNIHYLYRPGVWMNKEPDAFLDEALELKPVLIVLDSLSRIHSEEENNANAMASLFREAIQPLARETNAAVLVIHHTIKSDESNSYRRSRGSGDITAVVDNVLDARATDIPGRFYVVQGKSRRRLGGDIISVEIRDTVDGVSLVSSSPEDYEF